MLLTAIAGPLSNVALAAISIVLLAVSIRFHAVLGTALLGVVKLLQTFIFMNIILAVFNMLPIPPLDGSRVADALMPVALRPAWTSFCQIGPVVLAAVIILPMLTGVDLFRWPLAAAQSIVLQIVTVLGT
jgi:Zn-dependent protease